MVESWVIHCGFSLECQLLAALATCCDRKKMQMYLRIRKYIVQLMSNEHLDKIGLKHEDTLSIYLYIPSDNSSDVSRQPPQGDQSWSQTALHRS